MDHLFKPKTESEHDIVTSSDNYKLECHYQGHSFYSLTKAICIALHLIFLKYCPTRSRVSGSTLRRAIVHFFDFAAEWNSYHPVELWITKLTDLSSEVFKGFENYLREHDQRLENSSRLKTAIRNAASLTDTIPDIMLPFASRSITKAREPLSDDADQMLEKAFKSYADELYEKLEFQELVHNSKAYTFEEILAEISGSRTAIYEWLQHVFDNHQVFSWKSLHEKLEASTDTELQRISKLPNWKRVFFTQYENRDEQFRFSNPRNRFQGKIALRFNPDPARIVKTFLDNGYPFGMELREIGEKYAKNEIYSLNACKDVIQLILYRWRYPYNLPGTKTCILWDDLLALYFPTMSDMSCLTQFIMLQTNWNKESVLALDPENFEHALTGAMNEDYVMLQTEKNKSQGVGKPYYAPKEIVAASTRSDKYSALNLFKLAIQLSSPLKEYEFDYVRHGMHKEDYSTAFLCIRFSADWVKKGGRHTSSSNEKAFQQGTKQFLKKYPIYEDGVRLTGGNNLTFRLRPTWVKRQKAVRDVSHGLLALFMGHASTVTTDVHYDNSALAQRARYDRLESELEAILALMLSGRFEGMLGTTPQKAVQLPFKIFHIPGMEKPLWACTNQRQPAWHGARHRVKEGERCYVISKCVFCSQCTIFEDSLPYLVERRIHVTELIEDQAPSSSEYSNDLEVELMKIDSILDNWDDQQAVREAVRYQRQNTPLLPRDLNFLQVIIEEEDRK
ncbi:hypothetical protein ACX3YC_26465 [Pseudomonas mohnii]